MSSLPLAMHIPDGFLDAGVAAAARRAAVGAVALRRCGAPTRRSTSARVPLLGVTAAFVFAAQMLNFPVAGGTSGHFLGAAARGGRCSGRGSPAW